mmetsp:Transcript_60854/g.137607  ORF Transcript_60854/g.137607 Transcript_60854/m.137607 type:complete len:249 (+) Transcript_60854:616-1362(+)
MGCGHRGGAARPTTAATARGTARAEATRTAATEATEAAPPGVRGTQRGAPLWSSHSVQATPPGAPLATPPGTPPETWGQSCVSTGAKPTPAPMVAPTEEPVVQPVGRSLGRQGRSAARKSNCRPRKQKRRAKRRVKGGAKGRAKDGGKVPTGRARRWKVRPPRRRRRPSWARSSRPRPRAGPRAATGNPPASLRVRSTPTSRRIQRANEGQMGGASHSPSPSQVLRPTTRRIFSKIHGSTGVLKCKKL